MARIDMAKFAKFCKDNGFIFQSSEIYGGINGFWDYGPLGVELKKNIKDAWWLDMVRNPPPGPPTKDAEGNLVEGQEIRMVGLDCSIIMNPKVWEASGHVGGFSDPMVDCKACKGRFRADQFVVIEVTADPFNDAGGGKKIFYFSGLGDATQVKEANQKRIGKIHNPSKINPLVVVIGLFTETSEFGRLHTPCPSCEQVGHLTEPRAFNLMFESHAGPIASDENKVYLRPETAQGIFANFKNVLDSTRLKLPFGIAQIGKAFRNEINPRNYTFRSREFEQMEIEFFCKPSESMKWYEYWRDLRKNWYSTLGLKSDNLVPREQGQEELAFYSIGTTDIEYRFPFSDDPQELEGVAHRGSYDLTQHAKHSGLGDKLSYFDQDAWMEDEPARKAAGLGNSFEQWLKTNPSADEVAKYKFTPHVIEPSAGADRFTLAVLCEAFSEDTVPDAHGKPETRTVMRFHPRLAPIKCAVMPLVNKEGMPDKAMKLYRELKPHFNVFFDDKGAAGRRYRRQDEIGTPFCVMIDGDTLKDDTVTIRDRDTTHQRRVPMSQVRAEIDRALAPQ